MGLSMCKSRPTAVAPADEDGVKHRKPKSILGKGFSEMTTDYFVGRIIGQGKFGIIRIVKHKQSKEEFACKSIMKRKLVTKEDINDVIREVEILHHLSGNKHIVEVKEALEDRHYVHIVMEYCRGGELFDKIVERGCYSEHDAAALVRTIVRTVAHCHSMHVIHRDIKPENFLLSSTDSNAQVKATDFGLSVFYKSRQVFTEVVGSAFYIAPEVLMKGYSHQSDIWSCGVILYILLSGRPPFCGETDEKTFSKILEGRADFSSQPWPHVSGAAKDCVKRMLEPSPKKRATARQILKHAWMRENGSASDKPLNSAVLDRIKGFAVMNKLKKEALKVIALNLPSEEIVGLKKIFQAMDEDNSGSITTEELKSGLKGMDTRIPEHELLAIMDAIDCDGNGVLDYEEFLAATVHKSKANKEEALLHAFQHFDADNDGYITREELMVALGGQAGGQINEILADADKNNDGNIDYVEFAAMMLSGNTKTSHPAN